jgi:hypothetical protein
MPSKSTMLSMFSHHQNQPTCRTKIMAYAIQINNVEHVQSSSEPSHIPSSVEALLQKYANIFSESLTLPPHRECDHSIPLKEGSKPPNTRPYNVPFKQKDEVEKLMKALLQDAIIRPSSSPYSSPAILVRKKDES